MTQQESWGYWRPQFKSGQLTELTKEWFRRVECTACGAVVGRHSLGTVRKIVQRQDLP
ncbi:hypothetical protein [Streptomyces chryseus]|uniref:hypothetical protein n=1 Tax=Streptomyces chryseus TaxID=68186 RepID=UPI00142EF27A|nr:hypothetical protein [Streptomyces chryseus]GGX29414.1 hypothetical protein GCM10010353_50790 [Streptomyces chryseus]